MPPARALSSARRRPFNALQSTIAREVAVAPLAHRTVRCVTGHCPVHTPDGPVNYSGAPLDFPEGEEFSVKSPVHRTLSGGAPDSPVRQTRVPSVIPLRSLLNPFLGLFIG